MALKSPLQWAQKRKSKRFILLTSALVVFFYVVIVPLNRLPLVNQLGSLSAPMVLPSTYESSVNFKTGRDTRRETRALESSDTKKNHKDKNVQSGEIETSNLRTLLNSHFPYDPHSPTPKHVWQTWKVKFDSPEFPPYYKTFSRSWQKKVLYNPLRDPMEQDPEAEDYVHSPSSSASTLLKDEKDKQWVYSLIDDSEVESLIENIFHEVPAIVQAYKLLPTPILKADFFRYLILYSRGGIYSDMDTIPLKFLNTWPGNNPSYIKERVYKNDVMHTHGIRYKNMDLYFEAREQENDAYGTEEEGKEEVVQKQDLQPLTMTPGLVIGIEADPDRPDWAEYYARRIQFCQWTIQAKPGHPLLRELILNITATTLNTVSNKYMQRGYYSLEKTPLSNSNDELDKTDYFFRARGKQASSVDLKELAKTKNKNWNPEEIDGTDIMNWTGPGIFSDTVFNYMNNLLKYNNDIIIVNKNLEYDDIEKTTKKFYKDVSTNLVDENLFHWGFFSLLQDPILIDDIVVLPITAFSPDVGHMGSLSSLEDIALAKHYFSGSWKNEKQ
ncbi:hypothetical protein ACO0QE_002926 [Hanseniaspora vineae]